MRPEAALAGTPPLWGARGFGLSWADGRELPGTCELRSEAKQKVLSRSLPEVRAANWHLLAGRQAWPGSLRILKWNLWPSVLAWI